MQPRRILALVLALAALTLTAAACSASVSTGSSSTPSGSATPGGSTGKTYTNAQYKFSVTPDPALTQATSTGALSGNEAFSTAFLDPKGTKLNGSYKDGVFITVYKLARVLTPSEVPKLKKEFAGVMNQQLAAVDSAKVVEPLRVTQLNGVPGFRMAYTFKDGSTALAAISYFLVKGQYEYQVLAQASQSTWTALSPKLESTVKSFKVQ